MKIFKTITLALACILMLGTVGYAASSISGSSSSGTQGYTTCTGKLTKKNATKDYVKAKTTSGAKGKLSATAKIYWNNGTTTVSRSADTTNYNATSASATAKADNQYGIRGVGGHAYTSTEYGTWYGTTTVTY